MKVVFFSMHGSAAIDLTLLCKSAGVEFYLGNPKSRLITTRTKEIEIVGFSEMGARFPSDDNELVSLINDPNNAVILSSPGQIEEYKLNAWKAPFIVRHGLNSFDKFKALGTKNFITASKIAISKMPDCNCFLTRKLIPWDRFPRGNTFPEGRTDLSSFIHYYATKWPREYARFQELNKKVLLPIVNFGSGTDKGIVDDLAQMAKSKATVHIKGGNAVCNAVIRSMSVATPIVMDRVTYEACHFDCIDGIMVMDNIEDVASRLNLLASSDDYLEEQCCIAYEYARKQFVPDEELIGRFHAFLGELR